MIYELEYFTITYCGYERASDWAAHLGHAPPFCMDDCASSITFDGLVA